MEICNICNSKKELREAGIGRNGEPFDAFWSCPNWRNADHAKEKGKKAQFKPTPSAPQGSPSDSNGEVGALSRIELKIDYLIDILKPKEKEFELKYPLTKDEFQKVGDILLPDDEVNVKDIPF